MGRVLCWLGFHAEQRLKAPGAPGFYARCRRCGHERDIGHTIIH